MQVAHYGNCKTIGSSPTREDFPNPGPRLNVARAARRQDPEGSNVSDRA